MWLDPIPVGLRERALTAWQSGNWRSFLSGASHDYWLELVLMNTPEFLKRGCYENALAYAYGGGRTTQANFSSKVLREMFVLADRARLLDAGEPLPSQGPFTLYRGVAGPAKQRRIRGFSWSGSIMAAAWFAWRFEFLGTPALYKATVCKKDILFYTNDRKEDEYIVMLPKSTRLAQIPVPDKGLVERWHTERSRKQ
jgi:hypothetical protein